MYEHPYLSYRANELELEQLERAIARRRFIEEHADQIVIRPESGVRRAIRRMVGMASRKATTSDAGSSWVAPDAVNRRAASDAASGSRRTSAPCEPVPVR